MNLTATHPGERPPTARTRRFWVGWVLICFLAIAGFFLFTVFTEHRAHLFSALPYLLLLACPLLHFFLHRSHGGDGGHHGDGPIEGEKS